MKNCFTLTRMKRMNKGKRDAKNGFIWFYYVWDSEGNRRKYSTGQTSKAAAVNYCCQLLREGKLIPQKYNKAYFRTLVKDFFDPEKSPYLKEKANKGKVNAKSTLNNASRVLQKHILPFFGDMLAAEITKKEIGEWVAYLMGSGISNRTINIYLSYLKQIFHYLKAIEIVSTEPTDGYALSVPVKNETGILNDNEVEELMNEATIDSYWQGNRKMYLANLVSCLTGMRISEILALQEKNIKENYIDVVQTLNAYDGLKPPKNGKPRKVPIPNGLYEMLRGFFPDDGGFLFFDKGEPNFARKPREFFYDALAIMGISEKERQERTIHFHSWRHWLNSKLVNKNITISKIEALIGHQGKSNDMTRLYTHFNITDFEDVVRIQEELLESFRAREAA